MPSPTQELRVLALDALQHGVAITDARRRDEPVVWVTDAFLRLTGYARDEVVGRSLRLLHGPGTDPETLEALRTAVREDQPFLGRLLSYRRDGTSFWAALSLVPVHDEDGVTSHHVATLTDTTPLRAADLAAEHAGRLALLDAFAHAIAHDVNNVLLAASGYAELLSAKLVAPEHEQLRRYADQIVSSCRGAGDLTRQLLALGGLSDSRGATDAAEAAAAAAALAGALLAQPVMVRVEPAAEAATVGCSRRELERLLVDLLLAAGAAGSPEGGIELSVRSAGGAVQLTVTTSGELRPDAYFARGAIGPRTAAAVARRLDGTLTTRATDGGGTALVVTLPRPR